MATRRPSARYFVLGTITGAAIVSTWVVAFGLPARRVSHRALEIVDGVVGMREDAAVRLVYERVLGDWAADGRKTLPPQHATLAAGAGREHLFPYEASALLVLYCEGPTVRKVSVEIQ